MRVEFDESIKIGRKKYYFNLNQYRNWHFMVSNNIKKEFKPKESWNIPFFDKPIQIDYYFKLRSDADLDNKTVVIKFFQDWLVKNGRIPDDNKRFIVRYTVQEARKGDVSHCIITEQEPKETE